MKKKQERVAAKAVTKAAAPARETTLDNRRARYEYEKLDSVEAGIALTGTEIKSIRQGNVSINEAYARLREGELWLLNFTIPAYKEGSYFNHEPNRPRKLLLHREQIKRFTGRAAEKGLTLVPWRLYFKRGRVKIELALARGKKIWDRRREEQARDVQREIARAVGRSS
jgi:SsrA-binding protein